MTIKDIAYQLASEGRGILAADESTATIKKRLDTINVESTEETRRDYRQMLFDTQDAMTDYISGVILYDETLSQKTREGVSFVDLLQKSNSLIGIKVDQGAKALAGFPGETITEGLDNLRDRLKKYYNGGARFAKWRAVISIDNHLPSSSAIRQNVDALARYAALCQEEKIVPIVEPEILMDGAPGTHSIDRCYEVTQYVLREVFYALNEARIDLEGMVLKPNMVIDGKNIRKASVEEVAEKTVHCLKSVVPALVPSIAFLSGGQNDIEATAHLNAINQCGNLPWNVTFSYGRALQAEALKTWSGQEENVKEAQAAFAHRAKMNWLAALGKWSKDQE